MSWKAFNIFHIFVNKMGDIGNIYNNYIIKLQYYYIINILIYDYHHWLNICILIPVWWYLKEGIFGRWLDRQGGALINGIGALTKEILKSSFASFAAWGHDEKSCLWTGSESSLDTEFASVIILDFLASRTLRNKYLLSKLLNMCFFVIVAWRD